MYIDQNAIFCIKFIKRTLNSTYVLSLKCRQITSKARTHENINRIYFKWRTRLHSIGGGAPANFGRRRRAAGPKISASAAARRGRLSYQKSHTFSNLSAKNVYYKDMRVQLSYFSRLSGLKFAEKLLWGQFLNSKRMYNVKPCRLKFRFKYQPHLI